MTEGAFSNKPKTLRGALVEYGFSIPPLVVVFQFNPEQLARSRSVRFFGPNVSASDAPMLAGETEREEEGSASAAPNRSKSLREIHNRDYPDNDDLLAIQTAQQVEFTEESISFDIRLDASEALNEGNALVGEVGILPQLATLEQMMHAKSDGMIADALGLLGSGGGHSFMDRDRPPILLFIWGYTRVLPVNLQSMNISETAFNTHLAPTRATVGVTMQVIEGKSVPYTYSKVLKEAMSLLNLANIADLAHVVVPG